VVWAPNFWLPTPNIALRQLDLGYYCIDFDLGEFFLNFPLDKRCRKFVGVRMEAIGPILDWMACDCVRTHLFYVPLSAADQEAWTRVFMGFKPSPFHSVKFYYHAEEFVIGNPKERDSPLRCIYSPKYSVCILYSEFSLNKQCKT